MKLLVCSSIGSSYEHIFDKAIDLKEIFYHDLKKSKAMEYVLDFNTSYTVTLEEKNIKNLQKDGAVYWRYFDQIMKTAGFEK